MLDFFMKTRIFLGLFASSVCFGAVEQGELKTSIAQLREKSARSKNDPALFLELARLQLKDQQEYEALFSFVCALNSVKPLVKAISEAEKKHFFYFLERYFEGADFSCELEEDIKKHPDFISLRYFLAAKYANERKLEPFFTVFFECYSSHPDHYMADKSRGVLASLLLQKAVFEEQKEVWRKEALSYFKRACEKQPNDLGVHAMLIITASGAEKKEAVRFVINQILCSETVLPRTAIPTYVGYCLDVQDVEMAKVFLQKAATWYEYSRIIKQMEQVIMQAKVQ
jgi:tetratricopeptide (TPR) repeat protein